MKYGHFFLGAGLTLFGVWLGMAFATATDASAVARWWDLMTAFGTVGAAVAAVGVAFWQRCVLKRERRVEAAIKIGAAYPQFSTLKSALEHVRPCFECVLSVDRSPKEIIADIALIRQYYNEAVLPTPIELLPLGTSYARGLASVISHLSTVLKQIEGDRLETPEQRKRIANFVLQVMEVAIPNLQMLADEGHRLITELKFENGE